MSLFTADNLKQIMPRATAAKLAECADPLNAACAEFEITTRLRAAAFIAQLAHESNDLRNFQEIWGPTAAQKGYEGARRLGNMQKGDGKRYKGRGPIQITGRANYRKYGRLLDIDLEGEPEQAAQVDIGFRIAGVYWKTNGLNELADAGDFKAITKKINGGLTGYAARQAYYTKALAVLMEQPKPDPNASSLVDKLAANEDAKAAVQDVGKNAMKHLFTRIAQIAIGFWSALMAFDLRAWITLLLLLILVVSIIVLEWDRIKVGAQWLRGKLGL